MKKSFGSLLLLCVLTLGGCSASSEKLEAIEPIVPEQSAPEEPVTSEAPPVEQTPGETTPTTDAQATLAYEVTLINYAKDEYCQQDPAVLLARCDYMVPHMIASTQEGVTVEQDPIAAAFNAGFVDWDNGTNFAEILSWAQESYGWNQENDVDYGIYGYTDELVCNVYQTAHLVSVSGWYYSFTGGAHGNTWLMSWLFDTNTGMFISPLSLATDSQALLDGITNLLVLASVERAAEYDLLPEEMFWADYQEVLADWPSYAVTFDATGMTIGFSPYELAAYAAGSQIFTISYQELTPYFTPEILEILSGTAQ